MKREGGHHGQELTSDIVGMGQGGREMKKCRM